MAGYVVQRPSNRKQWRVTYFKEPVEGHQSIMVEATDKSEVRRLVVQHNLCNMGSIIAIDCV